MIIENINLESYDPFYWWADPVVSFPYNLLADDSLVFTVYLGITTDQPLGFVQDTMFVECDAGDHEVFIIVDEDIISAIPDNDNNPVINGIYPNPFESSVKLDINISETTTGSVNILDMRGNLINTIAKGTLNKGDQSFSWNGRNSNGEECPTGIYYLLVKTNKGQSGGKIIKR